MKKILNTLLLILLITCKNENDHQLNPYELHQITLGERIEMEAAGLIDLDENGPDWEAIKARGYLNLITQNSLTTYYIYKGTQMGYEFEVIQQFCKKIGLKLNVIVARDIHEMFFLLKTGAGDIVANNLNTSKERKAFLNLSAPYNHAHQVLVGRAGDSIQDLKGLDQKTIHIRNSAIFEQVLDSIQKFYNISLNIVRTDNEQEELLELLNEGQIEYTIADNNIAEINATFYDSLRIIKAVSNEEPIVWALRQKDTLILNEINDWIQKNNKGTTLNYIRNKYFSMAKTQESILNDNFYTGKTGQISPYDDLISQAVENTRFDWVWVSALIYQESRFDNRKKSWVGASGLMQLMPATARQFGAYRGAPPKINVSAGVKYLSYLDRYWTDSIPNVQERNHFILASYNAGPGHVQDARSLARKYGKNPNVWFNNVAEYLLLKSKKQYYHDPVVRHGYCRGSEPYNYVMDINLRHQEYQQILESYEKKASTPIKSIALN